MIYTFQNDYEYHPQNAVAFFSFECIWKKTCLNANIALFQMHGVGSYGVSFQQYTYHNENTLVLRINWKAHLS